MHGIVNLNTAFAQFIATYCMEITFINFIIENV